LRYAKTKRTKKITSFVAWLVGGGTSRVVDQRRCVERRDLTKTHSLLVAVTISLMKERETGTTEGEQGQFFFAMAITLASRVRDTARGRRWLLAIVRERVSEGWRAGEREERVSCDF
jgi:hypothetical protein